MLERDAAVNVTTASKLEVEMNPSLILRWTHARQPAVCLHKYSKCQLK